MQFSDLKTAQIDESSTLNFDDSQASQTHFKHHRSTASVPFFERCNSIINISDFELSPYKEKNKVT